jgi:hypothetical protein
MPNIFPTNGNVGINTTAPKEALEVLYGAGRFDQLANPASLTYAIAGHAGQAVYTYAVLAKDHNGNRTQAPTLVVNDGPATLSPGNHITISWGAVPHAVGYDVLKVVSNVWMLIGSTPLSTFNDTGGPTMAYTLPAHNETGHLQAGAFTATDTGSTLPLAMPYYGLPGRYLTGVNHKTNLFQELGSYDIGARIDSTVTGGGSWDDPSKATTGYLAVFANMVAGARGTNGVYFAYAKGLGAGDIVPFGADVEAWGGNGNLYATGPEAAACGEFDIAQGSHVEGRSIFQATITDTSPSGTELTYNPKTAKNEDALGARYILNHSRPKTTVGNVTGISIDTSTKQTTVTFSGVSFTSTDVGKYLKIGSTDDLYAPPLQGDDILMDGYGVGHWYRVIDLPAPNTLLLAGLYDKEALTMPNPTASYLLMEGAEILAFDQATNTITLQDPRNWAAGQFVYSPPHHLMALTGINIIINKKFKTSGAAGGIRSDTVRIVNYGPGRMDDAIWIAGVQSTPSQVLGGFRTGILFSSCNANIGIDMYLCTFPTAGIRFKGGGPTNGRILFGADETYPQIWGGGGDGIRIQGCAGNRSLFATDNANSAFIVLHPASPRPGIPSEEVRFLDGTGKQWLIQNQEGVTFQTQACSKRNVSAWAPVVTLDFSLGAVQEVTLSGATTLAFSNVLDGGEYTIHLVQDSIGGRTVTWPNNAKFPGPSNLPPALSAPPNKRDIFKAVGTDTHVYIYMWALGF